VEEQFPELIEENQDKIKVIKMQNMVPYLLGGIQEINAKLESQQKEIEELKQLIKSKL